MNSLVIGLTGGIGTGKSTAASILKQHGADVIDVDQIGRNVLYEDNDARAKVIDHFGASIIDADGGINRSALAKIVFSSEEHLAALEAISHPAINQALETRIGKQRAPVIILDMAILVEKKLAYVGNSPMYHKVVVIESQLRLRLERLSRRGLSKKEAEERIAAQATDNERKNVADYLIDNNGTIEDLSKEVDKLWGIVEIWHSNHSNDCMDRESEY